MINYIASIYSRYCNILFLNYNYSSMRWILELTSWSRHGWLIASSIWSVLWYIYIYLFLCIVYFVSVLTFYRLAMSGETLIRGDPYEVCRRVLGWDANSLYSFSMSQEMPTGVCQTRTAPDFVKKAPATKGTNHSKVSLEWLDFEAHKQGVTIFNASNGPEVKIGAGRVTLDGFEPTSCTAFLFQGCFWHACECQEGRDEDGRTSAKRARIEEMFGTSMEEFVDGMQWWGTTLLATARRS